MSLAVLTACLRFRDAASWHPGLLFIPCRAQPLQHRSQQHVPPQYQTAIFKSGQVACTPEGGPLQGTNLKQAPGDTTA